MQRGDVLAMLAFVGRMRGLLWRLVHEAGDPDVVACAQRARHALGDADTALHELLRAWGPPTGVAPTTAP